MSVTIPYWLDAALVIPRITAVVTHVLITSLANTCAYSNGSLVTSCPLSTNCQGFVYLFVTKGVLNWFLTPNQTCLRQDISQRFADDIDYSSDFDNFSYSFDHAVDISHPPITIPVSIKKHFSLRLSQPDPTDLPSASSNHRLYEHL